MTSPHNERLGELRFYSDLPPSFLYAVCADVHTQAHSLRHTLAQRTHKSLEGRSASHRAHAVDKTPCGWNTITHRDRKIYKVLCSKWRNNNSRRGMASKLCSRQSKCKSYTPFMSQLKVCVMWMWSKPTALPCIYRWNTTDSLISSHRNQ